MSKRNLYAKRQLQSLQRQGVERNQSIEIFLDFGRNGAKDLRLLAVAELPRKLIKTK